MHVDDQESGRPRTKREMGVEAQLIHRAARRARFLELFDIREGRGLEIGPLDSGIADPEVDDVAYLDVFDTAGLREHYQGDTNVLLELIPEVDFPIFQDGEARPLAEAAKPRAPYDWLIASHVIEHVPDVIGWLRQMAEVAANGAALLLAVPDRRYCFDRHRPQTTTGQALLAYEEGHVRPNTRALYDSYRSAVAVDPPALRRGGRPPGRDARMHDLELVMHAIEQGRDGEYVDCHVWTFTPQALLEQIREWRELGLCEWYVERLEDQPGSVEFLAVLRRVSRKGVTGDPDESALESDLPDWLYDEWRSRDRTKRLRRRLQAERQRVKRLRTENARLRSQLDVADPRPVAVRLKRALRRLRQAIDRH